MRIFIKCILFTFTFMITACHADSNIETDIVFVDRMMVSSATKKDKNQNIVASSFGYLFTNEDKIISYYAQIGVIRPKKKIYNIQLLCVNKQDKLFFKKRFKLELRKIVKDSSNINIFDTIFFNLYPKENMIVKGQILPLETGSDAENYYIKLFVDNKLIGVTPFSYGKQT